MLTLQSIHRAIARVVGSIWCMAALGVAVGFVHLALRDGLLPGYLALLGIMGSFATLSLLVQWAKFVLNRKPNFQKLINQLFVLGPIILTCFGLLMLEVYC